RQAGSEGAPDRLRGRARRQGGGDRDLRIAQAVQEVREEASPLRLRRGDRRREEPGRHADGGAEAGGGGRLRQQGAEGEALDGARQVVQQDGPIRGRGHEGDGGRVGDRRVGLSGGVRVAGGSGRGARYWRDLRHRAVVVWWGLVAAVTP